MRKPTQREMFYQEHRKIADGNNAFMELVRGGLKREELERLIAKRPSLWSRFSNWLDKLPSEVTV
jgi:hypothetical protein